ncbi:phosphatase PAP2 family protein [Polaribacter vadi]|uniref:phosphatase PAP2 family protein n=1 Tax=Polaribacter TaxID=52959 RepID=UPI001C083325|nr:MULTISPECIES: phosphatase PAP2 family protein [Polaribacter]MBU3011088.1 phosphatase PAP2 family protein [Polaribacter vadi]MDO6740902.1 phosphatase PAP2 family protein [Polaribacter sp. 1_MG-2023]
MKFLVTCFLFFFSISVISQNQTSDRNHLQTAGYVFKTSFNTIPSDFVFLGKEFSNDWKKTGYYTAGILGLIATDKITTKFYHNNIEPNIDYSLPNITPKFLRSSKNVWINGENSYLTYPIIGVYLGSLITNSERGQFAAANSLKAIAYSTIITQLSLKTILGRNRPNRPIDGVISEPFTNNNWDFFNSRDGYLYGSAKGTSLPSMHATGYFALAKVIQMEFDNYWIPYSIMAITFLSDIKSHEHWVSDMVAGGIIGTLIGRSIVKSSWKARGILPQKQRSISFNYIPQFSSEFTGIKIIANIE